MDASPYGKIRKFVLVSVIAVTLIPFALILWIGNFSFSHSIENATMASMRRISADHRQMIESFLKERTHDLELVFNTIDLASLIQPQTLASVFEQLQSTSSAFVDLGVFDENGIHKAYHGPYDLSGKSYKSKHWFKQTVENGIFISDVFLGYRKVPHFIIAVSKKTGARTWVIRATVDSQRFDHLVRQISIGKTGEAYLVNRQGVLQTNRRSGGNLMDALQENLPLPPKDEKVHTFIHGEFGSASFLYATTWLKDGNWLLVVRQEEADAFSALRAAWMPMLLISVIGMAAIVAIAFVLTGAIVRKMERVDSEKALLNQQLIGASRLAELGEMATGFAHEINNPLQIINAEMSLIKVLHEEMIESEELKEGDAYEQVADSMDQIKIQIGRCSKITASILKFGRQSESRPEPLDLAVAVPEIVTMVEKKAEVAGIAIERTLPAEPITVNADAARLQQVLLNLLNNAMDAITEHRGCKGGTITVNLFADDEGKASITVEDNGGGVAPEDMEKIFTPFFTTKPVGKGTGLGLSVCYGIIQQMKGDIKVASAVGKGTTFTIDLPIE